MPFAKCFYHIVWATKHRRPLIVPSYEKLIFAALEQKAREQHAELLIVNSVADHIHLAIIIPPAIAVGKLIGEFKGLSSFAVNDAFSPDEPFRWQESYGVLTFGERNLTLVREYIANQKEHHRTGSIHEYLERDE